MEDLFGKVVLITGGSSGIGAAMAEAFASKGAIVALHFNSGVDDARRIASGIEKKGGKVVMFKADLTDSRQATRLVEEVVQKFGHIDILINNAGSIVARVPLTEADDELIQRVFDINARSMLSVTRSVVPIMKKRGGCTIINLTSQAARTGGSLGTGLYASTKGYITTMTRALAKELVMDGIRVNAIAPGVIDTPIHDGITDQKTIETLKSAIPMRRLGTAKECAGAALFLASEQLASYITGQVIEVNGGQIMP
ncbi:SDR family NAD(P)-dependent oxidoreductase [Caballeronia insecticola]|uniref:Short-chain dehydrogenase/reductase SDR n=1 Tax=Caballeronia insecticola TaxID=758793 RepID=R4X407_9BURK|nr:SDR family NAD(P)-dependent oxidoreductase [Caballeronia insecticola]BAN26882.1 short-chain dehydrogenase/reductase SDR [Caballeronia insecticola]